MKILITGSAGFIGFHLHSYLKKKNLKFMVVIIYPQYQKKHKKFVYKR